MLAGIWIVFWKELIYTLRDRKTLIFMLLIPILLCPVSVYLSSRVVLRTHKMLAVRVVRIAAAAPTQEAYRRLVHDWFLGTEVADGVRLATSPTMQTLIRPELMAELGDLEPEVVTDPEAFDRWTRQLVGKIRKGIEGPASRRRGASIKLPREVQERALTFYQAVIKGLGLVEFVDPAALPDAPEDFAAPRLPAALRAVPQAREIAWAIKSGSISGYLELPAGVELLEEEQQRGLEVTFVHDSTSEVSREARARIAAVMHSAATEVVRKRLAAHGLDQSLLQPLAMKGETDLATASESAFARIIGAVPMFVIVLTLLGGIYPAIDLGAGEKERFTLETLLLSPLSRTEIALGKALVIFGAALTAAFLGLASMALSIQYLIPAQFVQMLDIHVQPGTVFAAALLTIPPAVSFAGVLLAISILARSFKEAQNYMTGFLYVMIFPPLAAVIPGLEMNWTLAFVPLVNVSLLARDFLQENTHWGYYAATLGSCLAVSALCVAYAIRQFRKEEVLFRS